MHAQSKHLKVCDITTINWRFIHYLFPHILAIVVSLNWIAACGGRGRLVRRRVMCQSEDLHTNIRREGGSLSQRRRLWHPQHRCLPEKDNSEATFTIPKKTQQPPPKKEEEGCLFGWCFFGGRNRSLCSHGLNMAVMAGGGMTSLDEGSRMCKKKESINALPQFPR